MQLGRDHLEHRAERAPFEPLRERIDHALGQLPGAPLAAALVA